ncbi:MAG: FdtA/QdtA family cupin domain-containing protein [Paramuribaculum sp.]|nr:FdtA/QdtA family cupin domain-containing protein [Paramuribaculum sp.]
MMDLLTPYIIDIPKVEDYRGNLSVLCDSGVLPFECVRAYWHTNFPTGEIGVPLAWYTTQEIVVVLSGSVEIETEGKSGFKTLRLDRPDHGAYIPPMTWRRIYSRSENAVALIVTSTLYDSTDCITDYDKFHNLISE